MNRRSLASPWSLALLAAPASAQQPVVAPPHFAKLAHTYSIVAWLAKPQGSATPALLEALKNFMYWENYDVRVRMDRKIDRVVREDMLRQRAGKT